MADGGGVAAPAFPDHSRYTTSTQRITSSEALARTLRLDEPTTDPVELYILEQDMYRRVMDRARPETREEAWRRFSDKHCCTIN